MEAVTRAKAKSRIQLLKIIQTTNTENNTTLPTDEWKSMFFIFEIESLYNHLEMNNVIHLEMGGPNVIRTARRRTQRDCLLPLRQT